VLFSVVSVQMFFKFHFMKKYFFVLFVVFTVLFSGCGKTQDVDLVSGLVSPSGVQAEQFFPKDVFVALKFGVDSEVQKDNVKALIGYLSTDFTESFVDGFEEGFNGAGKMDFETEFLPMMGEDSKFMFVVLGDSDEVRTMVVVYLVDPSFLIKELESAVDRGTSRKQQYKGFDIYNDNGKLIFITEYKDVFLVSSDLELMKNGLDRLENGGDSLLNESEYQRDLYGIDDNVAYFYINASDYLDKSLDAFKDYVDVDKLSAENDLSSEIIVLSVESDGFFISWDMFFDKDKTKNVDYSYLFNEPIYLYKNIPSAGLLMYSEFASFDSSFLEVIDALSANDDNFTNSFDSFKSYLSGEGVDFDKDVLTFLDKGYSFAMYDIGNIVPGFSFFVDASSNKDGAKNVVDFIAKNVESFDDGVKVKAEAEVSNHLTYGEIKVDSGKAFEYAFNAASFVKGLSGFDNARVEFNFGLNDNNIFYFTFYPDFEAGDFSSLIDDKDGFVSALDRIDGYNYGVFYVDIQAFVSYINKIVSFSDSVEGTNVLGDTDYAIFKVLISPFKSFVFGAKKFDGERYEFKGFLKIS